MAGAVSSPVPPTYYRKYVDLTLRLPPDVRHIVLDYLPRESVLEMGGVSRAWRLAATSHPEFYVIIDKMLHLNAAGPCTELFDQVAYAESAHLRVSLYLQIDTPRNEPRPDNDLVQLLSDILRHALQNILVHIDITASEAFLPAVLRALDVPAPYLRSLLLGEFPRQRGLDQDETVIHSPLFRDHAPLLRTVTLFNICISPETSMPCFASVTDVDISVSRMPGDAPLAQWFPAARSVEFRVARLAGFSFSGRPRVLDIGNLPYLSRLIISQELRLFVTRRLPARCRTIEICGFDEVDPLKFLADVAAPLSCELWTAASSSLTPQFFASIRSKSKSRSDSQLSRSFAYGKNAEPSVAEGGLEFLRPRLGEVVEMNIHQDTLRSSLLSWGGATLSGLTQLTITLDAILHDALWPPQPHLVFQSLHPTPYTASPLPDDLVIPQCPALCLLVIQASKRRISGYCWPDHIFALGCALGLRVGPSSAAQCALLVKNLEWRAPPQPGTLDALFSTVTCTRWS